MYRGCSADHYSFETFVREHLLVVVVECHAVWLEVLFTPFELLLIWRECGDKLSAGGLVQDVQSVSGAHAAQTGNSDLQSVRSHLEAIKK